MAASRSSWLLRGALLLALAVGGAVGQMVTPFQGQKKPPDGGVDVYVSAVLDRLLTVDDREYRFELDGFAVALKPTPTNATGCRRQCSTLRTWEPGDPCCDGLWLPHVELTNVRAYPDSRVERYWIEVGEGGEVAWASHVHAEFYTPMSFRAYADDANRGGVRFVPSTTALELFQPRTGTVLPGWVVRQIDIVPTVMNSSPMMLESAAATASAIGDPWPLRPRNTSVVPFTGALWRRGWVVAIYVNRISRYYVITAVLPLVLTSLVGLLVFGLKPSALDARLAIVVSLFLALTALQFVFSGFLPSSSTVVLTQQLCIVAYILLTLIGVESIICYSLVTTDTRRQHAVRTATANRQYHQRLARMRSAGGVAPTAADDSGFSDDSPPGVEEEKEAGRPGAASMDRAASAMDSGGGGAARAHRDAGGGTIPSGIGAAEQGLPRHAKALPAPAPTPSWRCASKVGQGAAPGGVPEVGLPGGQRRMRWLPFQTLRLREAGREVASSQAYAELLADRVDRWTFWFCLLGYIVAVAVIMAALAGKHPSLQLLSNDLVDGAEAQARA